MIAKKDRVKTKEASKRDNGHSRADLGTETTLVRKGPLVTLSFSHLLNLARIPIGAAHEGVLIVLFAFRVLSFLVA